METQLSVPILFSAYNFNYNYLYRLYLKLKHMLILFLLNTDDFLPRY